MANSLQDLLRAKREETERWMRQREAELRRGAAVLEARGRQAYAEAIRKGEKVIARTTQEVRELGREASRKADAVRAAVTPKAPAASPGPKARAAAPSKPAPQRPAPRSGLAENLRAATSGAVDEFTFGLADRALSAGEALVEGGPGGFVANYEDNMNERRRADAFDAEHYGVARNTGRVVGAVGSVAAMGAPAAIRGAAVLVPRVAAAVRGSTSLRGALAVPKAAGARQAANLGIKYGPDPRGLTKLFVAGGAASGAADQVVADGLTARRTDAADLTASAIGGAVNGLVTRYAGPTAGGAVGGAASSVLGDLGHGEDVSFDRALNDGRSDAIMGGAFGRFVTNKAAGLSRDMKGRLGEGLSEFKALARGDQVVGRQWRYYMNPKTRRRDYTVADHVFRSPDGNFRLGETKLGPEAELSVRQIQARERLGDNYIVDYWRFSDVGKMGGGAASPLGSALFDEEPPGSAIRRF